MILDVMPHSSKVKITTLKQHQYCCERVVLFEFFQKHHSIFVRVPLETRRKSLLVSYWECSDGVIAIRTDNNKAF